MLERAQTRHPDPQKDGMNISKDNYEIVRTAIFHSLEESQEMSFR